MLTRLIATLAALFIFATSDLALAEQVDQQQPLTYVYHPVALAANRANMEGGNAHLQPALDALIGQADKALSQPPVSVMEKEELPPSGDRHDYMSIALYAWPNPKTDDGLPYIIKDGQISPVAFLIPDKKHKGTMLSMVQTLSLAYYFTGYEPYAEHSALLLRTWFIDPETRMNPNLNFAQSWPGIHDGSQYGIIDFTGFSELPDWLSLLDGSPHWTKDNDASMRAWLAEYLGWLRDSSFGRAIRQSRNNHGSWYDTQVVAIALFLGENSLAQQVLEEAKLKRIVPQIAPDGSQPHELRRTKSWDYSVYNLRALFRLAQLGRAGGVDLWGYQSEDGRSLAGGLHYLLQYADHPQDWPHKQIYEVNPASLRELLLIADSLDEGMKYSNALVELGIAPGGGDRKLLLFELAGNR